MKYSFLVLLFFINIRSASFLDKNDGNINPNIENNNNENIMSSKIKIRVNSKTFRATLQDNNSTRAFIKMLPMTIKMTELNGNEKYFDLSKGLPTNSSNPRTIQNGDLMLFGSRTLVLFYKKNSPSYSYTKLGRIDKSIWFSVGVGFWKCNHPSLQF